MQYTGKYKRYPTQREAHYFLKGTEGPGEACTIVNICRKGMGIIFHPDVVIDVGTIIRVSVPIAGSSKPIELSGTLKWLDKMGFDIIGGIDLMYELNDVQLSKLNSLTASLTK